MSSPVVVGADGALGKLLVEALGARGVTLRHPGESLEARADAIVDEAVVVNVSGPRVRPRLGWADYLREHVGTSTAIAKAMRPGSHLVHFSSAAVYGARAGTVSPDSPEAPGLFPNPSYAWAKLAGELAVRAICRERGVGLTVLRPAMVYGHGVTSAIDTLAGLARRGLRLAMKPARVRQHALSSELLSSIVREVVARPAAGRVLLACDPFVFTNADLEGAMRGRRGGVPVPVSLPLATALARRWPLFPDREAPGALAAFAFLGLDNEFDGSDTYARLGLDPARFARERTLDPYLESIL